MKKVFNENLSLQGEMQYQKSGVAEFRSDSTPTDNFTRGKSSVSQRGRLHTAPNGNSLFVPEQHDPKLAQQKLYSGHNARVYKNKNYFFITFKYENKLSIDELEQKFGDDAQSIKEAIHNNKFNN